MIKNIKVYCDGSKELTAETQDGDNFFIVDICDAFNADTLGAEARKVYDALLDAYLFDFDMDWSVDMLKADLDGVIDMLFNSWCEDTFFFNAGLTLRDLYEYLNDAYMSDAIDEETYHYRLATLTDSAFTMGFNLV